MNAIRRKPTTRRQSPSLFDKWHGIFYMPSRIDEAGHTKAFDYPVAEHWGESRNVQPRTGAGTVCLVRGIVVCVCIGVCVCMYVCMCVCMSLTPSPLIRHTAILSKINVNKNIAYVGVVCGSRRWCCSYWNRSSIPDSDTHPD